MQNYIVYSSYLSLKPDSAHEIHDVMCANAVANLDYSTVLIYPDPQANFRDFSQWISPFKARKPQKDFLEFYNAQDKLNVAPLPIPIAIERLAKKWVNTSTIVCKYYFPFYIASSTKTVHTRDWNFVKAAVKQQIPTIYERHYFQDKP
ncbi:MAG: hypothetical protein MUD14_28825 [Hydrococcus sp. Prado102]|nr:hypothetical protein [Hydrococcus sp. Prado102]